MQNESISFINNIQKGGDLLITNKICFFFSFFPKLLILLLVRFMSENLKKNELYHFCASEWLVFWHHILEKKYLYKLLLMQLFFRNTIAIRFSFEHKSGNWFSQFKILRYPTSPVAQSKIFKSIPFYFKMRKLLLLFDYNLFYYICNVKRSSSVKCRWKVIYNSKRYTSRF